MNTKAWVAVVDDDGFTLGVAARGVRGYSPMREPIRFDTYEQASEIARDLNERLGLTPDEALEIVAASMR